MLVCYFVKRVGEQVLVFPVSSFTGSSAEELAVVEWCPVFCVVSSVGRTLDQVQLVARWRQRSEPLCCRWAALPLCCVLASAVKGVPAVRTGTFSCEAAVGFLCVPMCQFFEIVLVRRVERSITWKKSNTVQSAHFTRAVTVTKSVVFNVVTFSLCAQLSHDGLGRCVAPDRERSVQ